MGEFIVLNHIYLINITGKCVYKTQCELDQIDLCWSVSILFVDYLPRQRIYLFVEPGFLSKVWTLTHLDGILLIKLPKNVPPSCCTVAYGGILDNANVSVTFLSYL